MIDHRHLSILVCLRHLNDHPNAFLAFERSTMLIDAIQNPLIYLNFAIYCWRTNRIELAQSNLRNFYQMGENVGVRLEVMRRTIHSLLFFCPNP